METLKQMRYKDEKPDVTVKKLKKILKDNGIQVEEHWKKKSSVGTYSLRLCIKGTNIGQNGKGMTKDFAAASAYAEFFERYQNGILVFRQEAPSKEFPFVYSSDEKELTVEELLEEDNAFFDRILLDEHKENLSKKEKEEFFKELLGDYSKILKTSGKHISLPYYSVSQKKVVNLPHVLSCHLYCTNGMCAGNTPEEAMIEGISEILERYVSMRIIYDKPSLPEIPKSYLENFPKVYDMLEKLENNEQYMCKLLDCSFGGKYPVAGLVIMQKNTGRFGFKLGAHPDYGIAMERCFTEAAQGMDIYEYAQACLFDFKNENIESDENVREFVNTTVATIPYKVFSDEKTYNFTKIEDVSNLNNKQILKKLVNKIIEDGYDIFIRDVSVFGFPTFRIIIPGMTEFTHSPMAGRFKMFEEIEYLLKDFRRISLDNICDVIEIMKTQIDEVGNHSLYTFINVKDTSVLPYETIGMSSKYFLAMCYLMNQQYSEAEEILENIMFVAENLIAGCSLEKTWIKAVYYYASAMNQIKDHEKVIYYIGMIFDKNITEQVNNVFKDKSKLLLRHYQVDIDDYVDNDNSYFLPFMKKLKEVQKSNIIDQMKNKEIFGDEFRVKQKVK